MVSSPRNTDTTQPQSKEDVKSRALEALKITTNGLLGPTCALLKQKGYPQCQPRQMGFTTSSSLCSLDTFSHISRLVLEQMSPICSFSTRMAHTWDILGLEQG